MTLVSIQRPHPQPFLPHPSCFVIEEDLGTSGEVNVQVWPFKLHFALCTTSLAAAALALPTNQATGILRDLVVVPLQGVHAGQSSKFTNFLQWLNQSHNACVNYANRNASKVSFYKTTIKLRATNDSYFWLLF